jgi:hypothetical protein
VKKKNKKSLGKAEAASPPILTLAELCEGIDDREKELAAAWELAREVRGRLQEMTNRNKRGRKYRSARIFPMGKEAKRTKGRNYWFHDHFNSWALTFTKSKKWPKTAYRDLKPEERWEAFPEAPVFQKSYLEAFKSTSLASAAEMITPEGGFKSPWSGKLLDQLFHPGTRPVRTSYRLIKIDSSFPMETIRNEMNEILREHCPHKRSKGGNIFSTWLRNLGLYRAHKAGWGIKQMDDCWKRARALEKSQKSYLTKRIKYGLPPRQKLQKRIDSIKHLLVDIF